MNTAPVASAPGRQPGLLQAVEESLQDLLARRGAAFAILRRTGDMTVEVTGVTAGRLHLEFDPDASPAEVRDTVEAALEHFPTSRSSRR